MFPKVHNFLTRPKLELRGSRSGLRIGPRNFRGVRSAQLFALAPNLTTKGALLEVRRGFGG
eukprot:15478681-Alexandrium_andersonii.AAC.1